MMIQNTKVQQGIFELENGGGLFGERKKNAAFIFLTKILRSSRIPEQSCKGYLGF
jgi:hypothetical protein